MNTIKEGSKDTAAVKLWQKRIGVKDDGVFGPGTTAATKAFQRAHGLDADGIVGPKTWAASEPKTAPQAAVTKQVATANAASTAVKDVQQQKAAVKPTPTPAPITPTVNAQPTLREGASGPDVERWQKIINVQADGKFGPATTAGTKVFQRAHGLDADGVVGPKTWAAGLAVKAPTAKPATPAAAVQKKAETVNAATTAANVIRQSKPKASEPPPQTIRETIKVTEKIVREKAKAVKNRAGAVKDKVTKHVNNAPQWLRIFSVGVLGLGGLAVYKSVSESKRRA